MNNPFISAAQLASILQITEDTINGFAKKGQIPYTQFNIGQASTVALFNPQHVIAWMLKVPTMENMNDYLLSLRKQIQEQCPEALKALQDFDSHIASPRKGFCLVKVPNKKHGFLYYVRYTEKGKTLPSRWNTHTNDKHLAELFAKENRARILADYHAKKQQKNNLYTILTNYYKADSPYLAVDKQRGRILSDRIRGLHYRFIVNTFIPFLKERHINGFDGITPPLMVAFQNYLLAKNLKPRTVNDYMRGVSAVFAHLTMTGVIPANVFKTMERLEVKQDDSASRGCHDISKVQGVFDKTWEDLQSYLLCLIIYTTGMRNREIEKIQVKDSIACGDTMFIDIPRSKTKSGIRIVPVHPFVNEKLRLYIEGTGKGAEDYLFSKEGGTNQSPVYRKANRDLGALLGTKEAELEAQYITFYSGLHFWKTLMSAGGLGEDVEEYFMGHKVSSDVAKRYNKQGKDKLIEKALEIFAILDKSLFGKSYMSGALGALAEGASDMEDSEG